MSENSIVVYERDDVHAALWETEQFDVAFVSAKAPDKAANEDALFGIELANGSLAVCVVDGMGGMVNGLAAARTSLDSILARARVTRSTTSRAGLLVDGFEQAHQNVSEHFPGGGATAVAAIVTPSCVQTVHAGDAEALVIGPRGKLRHRTVAQSPVGYAMHAGLLSEEDALFHPERHLVSNGIGIEGMTIMVSPRVKFAHRDTLVLASDGLTDNVFEAELCDALAKGPVQRQLDRLAALTWERMCNSTGGVETGSPGMGSHGMGDPAKTALGKPDDLTVIVVRQKAT